MVDLRIFSASMRHDLTNHSFPDFQFKTVGRQETIEEEVKLFLFIYHGRANSSQ